MHSDLDSLAVSPNLKAMFSRSTGVESFVNHPKLPNAPLRKIEPPGGDPMMTEYLVMHVLLLRLHRDMLCIKRLRSSGSGAAQRLCRPNSTPKPPFASINSNAAHAPNRTSP
jgi:glyoxylate/hydroxypyruvate reductase